MSRSSRQGVNVKAKVRTTIEFKNECAFCNGPPTTKESPFNKRCRPLEKTTHTGSYETENVFITFTETEERVIKSRTDMTKVDAGEKKVKSKGRRRRHHKKRRLSDIDIEEENAILLKDIEKREEMRIKKRLGLLPDPEGQNEKMLREVGPHWYQELSYNQMMFAHVLGHWLVLDMEEFNLTRVHTVMAGLGIVPRPTNAQILKAARQSQLNPVLFLIYLFKFTSSEETFFARKYSVNDRILLSAMAYIALPRTLLDLESRLPKNFFQKPPFVAKRTYKPLTQGMSQTYYKNKKLKPQSPYLQTLPYFVMRCRENETLFKREERYLNKLAFKPRTPSKLTLNQIIADSSTQDLKTKKREVIEDSLLLVKSGPEDKRKHVPPRRSSKIEERTMSEITVHFVEVASNETAEPPEPPPTAAKPRARVQIVANDEDDDDEQEIGSTTPSELPTIAPKEPAEGNESGTEEKEDAKIVHMEPDLVPDKDSPTDGAVPAATDPYAGLDDDDDDEKAKPEASNKVYNRTEHGDYTPIDSVLDSLDAAFQLAMSKMVPDPAAVPDLPEETLEIGTDSLELLMKKCEELPAPLPTRPSILAALAGYWEGFGMDVSELGSSGPSFEKIESSSSLSKKHHVVALLEKMGEEGNVLAAMPDIERLPALVEWFEYSEVPTLTAKKKDQLLMSSKGQWEVHQLYPQIVPIPYPKFQAVQLDWSQKNWFKRKVDELYDKYREDMRRAQVNDARNYWNTMCMKDFRSPPTFKDVYFAYLQAREEDTAQKKLFFL